MIEDRQTHWQQVYTTKVEDGVSWFEQNPDLSLALLDEAGLEARHAIIDIGGGASRLVDALVARQQDWVSVLDLSQAALETARARLSVDARTSWIASDVTQWQPDRLYDVWHDRAAFHFLTTPQEQTAYRDVLKRALRPGGMVVIGTFAPDGPEKCSGLTVSRHDSDSLGKILGESFTLVAQRRHEHVTPWGSVQKFQFSTFRHGP